MPDDQPSEATDLALLVSEVRRQTPWIRLLGLQALTPVLQSTLATDKQRVVYELSDGRSVREIAKAAGVGVGTVSRLWSEWASIGIVRESHNQSGRWEHLARLSQLGIESSEEAH